MRCPCCKQKVDEDVFDERLPILFDGNYVIYREKTARLTPTELDTFTYIWNESFGIDRSALVLKVYGSTQNERKIHTVTAGIRVKILPLGLVIVTTTARRIRLVTLEDFNTMDLPWRRRYVHV